MNDHVAQFVSHPRLTEEQWSRVSEIERASVAMVQSILNNTHQSPATGVHIGLAVARLHEVVLAAVRAIHLESVPDDSKRRAAPVDSATKKK